MARALCITPAKMALFTHHCLNHSSILLLILLLLFSLSDYRLRRGHKDSARNRYELNGPISISRYVGQSIGGSLLKRCEHHRQKLSARREDIKGRAEQEQIKLELMAQPELRWDLFREYAMYVKTTVTCMNGIILLV
jgi:hypothetical protein